MANPYHDENGQFCSREDMGAAVDRLAEAGNVHKALELSKELSAIQASNDAELRAQLNAFINSEPVASALKKPAPSGPQLRDDERAELVERAYRMVNEGADRSGETATAVDDVIKQLDGKGLRQVINDQQAPQYALASALAAAGKVRGAKMVLDSNNPRAAIAYADAHGWPTGDGNLEFEELAYKATDSRSRRMFARYTTTAFGASFVLQDLDTTGGELALLAGNPNITMTEAQQIVSLGGEHSGDYTRIRRELLRNPTVGPRLRDTLGGPGEAFAEAVRPERIDEADPHYRKTLENLDADEARLLKMTANPRSSDDEVDLAERQQVTVERKRRNVKAEFNASDPARTARLNAIVAIGDLHPEYDQAESDLNDVRGYLQQVADFNAIFG